MLFQSWYSDPGFVYIGYFSEWATSFHGSLGGHTTPFNTYDEFIDGHCSKADWRPAPETYFSPSVWDDEWGEDHAGATLHLTPAPISSVLVGTGLVGVAALRRRRRAHATLL